MMNFEQFVSKTAEMRKTQKEYFHSRDPRTLRKSKALEAEIDREIKRIQETNAAERYPLIKSPIYRRCLEDIIRQIQAWMDSRGGAENLKSHPIKQIAMAGNLNADFMLRHFAGIFDGKSPLSSGQRNAVKSILTDAACKMAEMQGAAMQQAEKEAAQP